MPHTKLAASEQFRGKSKGGLYGDAVEEIEKKWAETEKTDRDRESHR